MTQRKKISETVLSPKKFLPVSSGKLSQHLVGSGGTLVSAEVVRLLFWAYTL